MVQLLLKNNANVNTVNKNDETALHLGLYSRKFIYLFIIFIFFFAKASLAGHKEIVQTLLTKQGINVNAVRNDGKTALHLGINVHNYSKTHLIEPRITEQIA